jgi:hypothetical protein
MYAREGGREGGGIGSRPDFAQQTRGFCWRRWVLRSGPTCQRYGMHNQRWSHARKKRGWQHGPPRKRLNQRKGAELRGVITGPARREIAGPVENRPKRWARLFLFYIFCFFFFYNYFKFQFSKLNSNLCFKCTSKILAWCIPSFFIYIFSRWILQ